GLGHDVDDDGGHERLRKSREGGQAQSTGPSAPYRAVGTGDGAASGAEDGVQIADRVAAAESFDLEQHRDAGDLGAELFDQLAAGGEGATGGQDVVDEQHAGAGRQ